MTNGAVSPPLLRRFSPRSFRGKFILVVGTAVLFDMLLGGGIALVPLKGGWIRIDVPTKGEAGNVGADLNWMLEQVDEPKRAARHTKGISEAEEAKGAFFGLDHLAESEREQHSLNAEDIENGNVDVLMPKIGGDKIDDDITLLVMGAR